MGRIVRPIKNQAAILAELLEDPAFNNVYFDISWSEVAKYIVASPDSVQVAAALINRHPDRFLFGTDEVAPSDQQTYLRVYYQYDLLWGTLSRDAMESVRKGNYQRLFDIARRKVRAWEAAHPSQ
jgi:predicted TIM-barrel fold metal-dependent hydrolase